MSNLWISIIYTNRLFSKHIRKKGEEMKYSKEELEDAIEATCSVCGSVIDLHTIEDGTLGIEVLCLECIENLLTDIRNNQLDKGGENENRHLFKEDS